MNQFILGETERQLLEQQFKNGNVILRLQGPAEGADNLFTWESGSTGDALTAPTLHLVVIPGKYVIVTNTPKPENVLTAASYVVRGTDAAKRNVYADRIPAGCRNGDPRGRENRN